MPKDKLKIFDEIASQLYAFKLPTNRDIIKAIYYEKTNKTNDGAIRSVAQYVSELWQQSSIPSACVRRVKDRVERCFNKYTALCKTDFGHIKNKKKLDLFKVKLPHLTMFFFYSNYLESI